MSDNGDDYQEYLDRWREHYGDAVTADATIYIYGQKFSMPIRRMTADKHADATAKLSALNECTSAAIDAEAWDDIEMLLGSALAFEIVLLI